MSLANIRRKLVVGQRLELVHHSWFSDVPPKLAGVRSIATVRANSIDIAVLSYVSRLQIPPATHIRETPNGFEVALADAPNPPNWDEVMRYEWRD